MRNPTTSVWSLIFVFADLLIDSQQQELAWSVAMVCFIIPRSTNVVVDCVLLQDQKHPSNFWADSE